MGGIGRKVNMRLLTHWFGRKTELPKLSDILTADAALTPTLSLPSAHPARFARAEVYFVWTQATSKRINLGQAVQALLDAEIATSAAWPSEDRVRVAPSIAKIDRDVRKLRALQAFTEKIDGIRALLVAFISHPVMAMRLIAATRQGLASNGADENPFDENETPLADMLAEVDVHLINWQKVSIAERDIDGNLFGGEAQLEDHYVRLVLRSTHHEIDINGVGHDFTIEPRLLMHRDGAIQLTLGVNLPTGLNADQLIAGAYPTIDYITGSRIPEPFGGPKATWTGGHWESERDGGVRIRSFEHEVSASILDYVGLITDRVHNLIKSRPNGEWNCYPVVMTQAGNRCDNWSFTHHEELRRVAARFQDTQGVQFKLPLGTDFSVQSDHVIHVDAASSLVVYWREWTPGMQDLNVTMLLEHTLLVYIRLRRLEGDIHKFKTARRDVLRLYRTSLQLAREARGASIRWGTGRTISRHLLSELGATEIRETVDSGLTLLGERTAARTAAKSTTAAGRLSAIGLIVAVFAAIPQLPAVLDLIAEQRQLNPEATGWSIVQALSGSPLLLSTVVLCGICLYFLLNFTILTVRVVRHLLASRKRGYASKIEGYNIVFGNTDSETI